MCCADGTPSPLSQRLSASDVVGKIVALGSRVDQVREGGGGRIDDPRTAIQTKATAGTKRWPRSGTDISVDEYDALAQKKSRRGDKEHDRR